MSMETNKALARSCMDLINERNFGAIDQLYSPTYVRHDCDNPQISNRNAYKQYLNGLLSIFPDLQSSVEDVIAEGDKVVCRFSISGTHTNPWRGLPATGKTVTVNGLLVSQIVDNMIVEDWFNTNISSLAQQLGVTSAAAK